MTTDCPRCRHSGRKKCQCVDPAETRTTQALADEIVDIVLTYQGQGVGTPHAAVRAAIEAAGQAVETCHMVHEEPYDFASCETHDTTFALGDKCKFEGRVMWEVYAEEADAQRARAVIAEDEARMMGERYAGALEQIREAKAYRDSAECKLREAAERIDAALMQAEMAEQEVVAAAGTSSSGEVGTGAGEGTHRQLISVPTLDPGSAWWTRSEDSPEAPAQAHLPAHRKGANAEDCDACTGRNLPYPWICDGGEADGD